MKGHVLETHPDRYDSVGIRLARPSFPVLMREYLSGRTTIGTRDHVWEDNAATQINPDSEPGRIVTAILTALSTHHANNPERSQTALAVLQTRTTDVVECVLYNGYHQYKYVLTVDRCPSGHYRVRIR